jgi:cellulose synthase/poly-beta-1,6-N-acetylglucosamine synthase-like glycosyltransferase
MEYLLDWAVAILTIMYAVILMAYRFWFGKMRVFQLNQIEQVRPEQSATQFTVIIPARNEAANIKACVDSILNQDYPDAAFEIIVIDDFSEDDTAFIVHALSQQYPTSTFIEISRSLQRRRDLGV